VKVGGLSKGRWLGVQASLLSHEYRQLASPRYTTRADEVEGGFSCLHPTIAALLFSIVAKPTKEYYTMKYLFLLLCLITACNVPMQPECEVVYCTNSVTRKEVLRCGPCDSSLSGEPVWEPIQSINYKSKVGEWYLYYCPENNYEILGNSKSVVVGLGNYYQACLFESEYLDVSHYSPGTLIRVIVTQTGNSSTITDTGFYSQLYIRLYDDRSITGELLQFMKYESNNEYVAIYLFELPMSASRINFYLGVDPLYIEARNQPPVRLDTVRVEALE
jgi:hypothetical protein